MIDRLLAHLFRPIQGYQHPLVVDIIHRKTQAYYPVRNDSAFLGAESVLDFGGGAGLHNLEAMISTTTRWAIVETPAMCARCRQDATPTMQWFTSIEFAARWLGPIDIVHCNGALQYSPAPHLDLLSLTALRAKRILWRRTPLAAHGSFTTIQTSYLSDQGPGKIDLVWNRRVQYPCTLLHKDVFMAAHHGYRCTTKAHDSYVFELKDQQ